MMSFEVDRRQVQAVTRDALGAVQKAFDSYQKTYFVDRPPEFFCLELCGEVGELANLEKKRWRGMDINEQAVADEAADVLIALMNFCNARGITLSEAVADKLERIAPSRGSRP
jgi:NTP pyrophosphatase (non-canonical NTP hydrolase)